MVRELIRTRIRHHLLSAFAGNLSSPIDQEDFNFYATKLYGQEQQRPRWKRVINEEGG